ncbi:putative bifunctional diguanylate cyclase/phosphodiesterase [Cucumibacter marinus]|uniref:putative bifunctional diguanylate cyclase/phosphodiesterase n=1 Tax=Cucumibacter marinus TaxID=1121252 RepID=UPI0004084467|nr:EAL domain-containing protein [Cucumibacter marinus]
MFQSARKALPPLDYVSIVRSLYDDKRTMAMGTLVSVVGSLSSAYKTGSIALLAVAVTFVLIGIGRWIDMTDFERHYLAPDDVDTAAHWELRSTIGACFIAALYGIWCFIAIAILDDSYSELVALSVTMASMVGVAARNFGVDRLVTLQSALTGFPLTFSLFLVGDIYHSVLALLFGPFFLSLRKIAATVRSILLTALHRRIEATRLAQELDTALDTMQHGLCMLDENGLVAVVNDRAKQIFAHFAPGSWTGMSFAQLVNDAANRTNAMLPRHAARSLVEAIEKGGTRKLLLHISDSYQCEVTISSRHGRTVLLFEDITERVKAQERINYMARFDALTGLPNRTFFKEQVEADLANPFYAEDPGVSALLMVIDLDDFKHVNDSLGHVAGDALLSGTSDRLRKVIDADCVLSRFGGDEFALFAIGEFTEARARELADKVLAVFAEPFTHDRQTIAGGACLGYVLSVAQDEDFDGLLTKADLALYQAKAEGRGAVQAFVEEMDTEYRYRQRLKADLRAAVDAHDLTLVYQPIVDHRTQKVAGCEALARWTHPELGSISPMIFIPLAEEMGLISRITQWVLEAATRDCLDWPDHIYVSVNISTNDFRHGDVPRMVQNALDRSGLSPERLEIEITENVFLEEKGTALNVLNELTAKGIGIALDDFGTGYSSLSYLHDLPFTKLKIDRAFVVDVASSDRSLKLLSNIARLSKDLEMTVTVEGVETEEQLALIASHAEIDHIQGFLFGMPLPRAEIGALIDRLARRSRKMPAVRRTA